MLAILKTILLAFLVLNGTFWAFAKHEWHCSAVEKLKMTCRDAVVYRSIGGACLVLAAIAYFAIDSA